MTPRILFGYFAGLWTCIALTDLGAPGWLCVTGGLVVAGLAERSKTWLARCMGGK